MSGFWQCSSQQGGPETNYPEANAFADLPPAAAESGKTYLVRSSSGTWPFNYKAAGLYRSNGSVWAWLGDVANEASEIAFSPAGSIQAATLQAAVEELDTDKVAIGHGHAISDVTNLQSALDGKQPSGSYAAASHGHSDATTSASGFMSGADKTKLDGVASAATANATDAQLRDRTTHTGTQSVSTITGLAAIATSGSAADLSGNLAVARLNGGSGASGSTFWRGDGAWAAPSGGSDPWTYIRLASDFQTSSATAVDITGLSFTPSANKFYEFEAHLLTRTATATVGPRPGLAWPTGANDGVVSIRQPSSATAEVQAHGNINAAVLAPVGGLPNTAQSYGARIAGTIATGASPSGTVKLQLASETAGTNVTVKAGSWLKYREVP